MNFPNPLEVRPDSPHSIRADLFFPNGELVANCGSDRDVANELARRWNAHAALVAERDALRGACEGLLESMRELASNAGDVPEWNEDGHAYEACKAARAALARVGGREVTVGPP